MTRIPCGNVWINWRLVPAALFVCLLAAPAFAQVPQETIDQIVSLRVQLAEVRHLNHSGQMDDSTWSARRSAINAELRALGQQFRQFSADDQRQADSQIDGLTKARLSTLEPQWNAKGEEFQRKRDQHDREVRDAITVDARAALEPQRQRLLLQQRRDRGEIAPEAFEAEDKKALDEIMALRGKYATEGQRYAERFDHELGLLTQGIAKNPETPLPVSRTRAGPGQQGGTSPADYRRDVALASELNVQWKEVRDRYWIKKEIPIETLRESQKIIRTDISRLSQKWRAAGRGDEFERDYEQGLAATTATAQPPAGATNAREDSENAAAAIGVLGFIGVIALVGGGIVWLLIRASRRAPTSARPVSTVHGTAHYAPTELSVLDDACLTKGLFFGKSSAPELVRLPLDAPGAPVCSTPEHHTLIVARTRTGKGTRVIVPTLLRYGGSAFVIDPKGENAAVTARVRRDELGQDIHILNPWNELAETYHGRGFVTATYNPLDILDRNDPNVVAIAQALAGAVCPAPANAKDRFWQGSASNVLTAVFLWLADHEGLGEGLGEPKTLGRARQIVSLTRKEFTDKHLVPMAASKAFDGAIRELAAPFIDLADETYSGVMSNLSESTKFLSDPQVKAATATSSFSMEDLAAKTTTVYVVIPTDRMDTQKTWLRLVIAAAMHTFKRPKQKRVARHRTLFLIDEFAALGRLDDLPRDIATMGGFGVDFALVVQGLDQLKDHYGEAKGTILSNCAYKWFCDVNDLESAKYLSDTLGKATVSTSSSSASSSAGPGGGSSSQSTTYSETGRFLLNPDEVLNLGKNVAITIQPNGHAQYVRPVDYWNLPLAFTSLREGHPSLYWSPPLTYDQNPYIESHDTEVDEVSAGQELGQNTRAR